MTEAQLICICSDLAELMVKYGAEIYRVEDTVTRICLAYSHDDAQVYVTPANFMITVKDKKGLPLTETRSISGRSTNLDRVAALNELSRMICARKPSADRIRGELEKIKCRPVYSEYVLYLSYAVVGAAFTIFYGGTVYESLFGAVLACLVKLLSGRLSKLRTGVFFDSVVCSAALSLCAVGFAELGLVESFDKIIIGASMTLVPGIQMTNCMRDFITGDLISGLYTMTEALIVAAGLAVGAGSAVAAVIVF